MAEERIILMYLLECILLVFWMLIVPALLGTLIVNQLFKEKETDLLLAIVCGVISMLAIFYILMMPFLFLKLPLHTLVICWSTLVLILCALALFVNRKRLRDIFRYNLHNIKLLPWFCVLIILLVLAQAFVLASYQHEDADDAFYVASATTAVATDTIFQYDPYTGLLLDAYPARYVLSPFPIFIAALSKLVLIHPTIISHTIFPAVLIPFSYVILTVLGKRIFSNQTNAVLLFLLFVCVLNIFGNTSIYTNSTFLLFRIWQGKAVLANIILPAIAYFSLRAMNRDNNCGEWMMLFASALTACLVSSFGIVLAPIMIALFGLVFAVRNKMIRTFVYSITCCTPFIACGIISILR
ncbi:MAG: DUF6077 domain-containing protein [Eubacteriales bacterium]